jgi:hypothetical protein
MERPESPGFTSRQNSGAVAGEGGVISTAGDSLLFSTPVQFTNGMRSEIA